MPDWRSGHLIQVDVHAATALRAHLAGAAGDAGRAHVLHADDGIGLCGSSKEASKSSFSMKGSPT
jgi:hypothetical protein